LETSKAFQAELALRQGRIAEAGSPGRGIGRVLRCGVSFPIRARRLCSSRAFLPAPACQLRSGRTPCWSRSAPLASIRIFTSPVSQITRQSFWPLLGLSRRRDTGLISTDSQLITTYFSSPRCPSFFSDCSNLTPWEKSDYDNAKRVPIHANINFVRGLANVLVQKGVIGKESPGI